MGEVVFEAPSAVVDEVEAQAADPTSKLVAAQNIIAVQCRKTSTDSQEPTEDAQSTSRKAKSISLKQKR